MSRKKKRNELVSVVGEKIARSERVPSKGRAKIMAARTLGTKIARTMQ
jgi:hypothetical protein